MKSSAGNGTNSQIGKHNSSINEMYDKNRNNLSIQKNMTKTVSQTTLGRNQAPTLNMNQHSSGVGKKTPSSPDVN